MQDAVLIMRYRMPTGRTVDMDMSLDGLVQQPVTLQGTGDFSLLRLPLGNVPSGARLLTLTSHGGAHLQIDGLAIVSADEEALLRFEPVIWNPAPRQLAGPRADTLVLKYEYVDQFYGLAWGSEPFVVREFLCEELDTFMRQKVHEHVQRLLEGPGDGHFTNVFMRPIVLQPHQEQTIFGLVCNGSEQAVQQRLSGFDPQDPRWVRAHPQARARPPHQRRGGPPPRRGAPPHRQPALQSIRRHVPLQPGAHGGNSADKCHVPGARARHVDSPQRPRPLVGLPLHLGLRLHRPGVA
jgi:hypothetical protein